MMHGPDMLAAMKRSFADAAARFPTHTPPGKPTQRPVPGGRLDADPVHERGSTTPRGQRRP